MKVSDSFFLSSIVFIPSFLLILFTPRVYHLFLLQIILLALVCCEVFGALRMPGTTAAVLPSHPLDGLECPLPLSQTSIYAVRVSPLMEISLSRCGFYCIYIYKYVCKIVSKILSNFLSFSKNSLFIVHSQYPFWNYYPAAAPYNGAQHGLAPVPEHMQAYHPNYHMPVRNAAGSLLSAYEDNTNVNTSTGTFYNTGYNPSPNNGGMNYQ